MFTAETGPQLAAGIEVRVEYQDEAIMYEVLLISRSLGKFSVSVFNASSVNRKKRDRG